VAAVNAAFKDLGVNPAKIKADVQQIIDAFDTLAKSDQVSGTQLLAGLEAALKRIDDKKYLETLRESLNAAFVEGRISVGEFDKGLKALRDSQAKFDQAAGKNTESLQKQAASADRAKEAQERVRLELEKLASNERIKLIEARVAIDVARVQADAERVKAAFESINQTIDSTGDIINKAFGALAGGEFIDSSTRNALFRQLDTENARRDRALQLQAELTQAQINLLRQQANSMERGDALVKIDGAGLQPHLEAFMWEILKTIQVRVNRDGLGLLLGL
jgi:flagellin-like hook-associated protein FlgL